MRLWLWIAGLSSLLLALWGGLYPQGGLDPAIPAFGPAASQIAAALFRQRLYWGSGAFLGLGWLASVTMLLRAWLRQRGWREQQRPGIPTEAQAQPQAQATARARGYRQEG